jgi:prepilin peptidase CpaA
MPLSIWLVLAACLVAAYFDIRTRRISNWLTGGLATAALVVHAFGGVRSLALTIAIMAIATLIGGLLYSRGGIGGGDVKLVIAASGMLGYPDCISFLLYSALAGGLVAIGYLALRGKRLLGSVAGGSQTILDGGRQRMPYAVAFALGATTLSLSQTIAPFLRISL